MKPPPLLRAVKPPALPPPPPRSSAVTKARAEEATGARPRKSALRVGRYEVDARIATGGMATVHLGRVLGAAGFSRIVAIKRLLPQFAADPEFESMFVAEAQLAARIHHPNVVPTLDVVSSEGELLLVMEYVAGESLARLTTNARAAGDVPQPVALAIICDALHGLHAAHEAKDRHGKPLGIVHRDMSPQNVIVGVDGVSRVIDFGIAKAANSVNITREGMVRGKAAYMAPEQLCCEPLTRRTDLYPLGVILWELLVGDRLFPGGARPDLIAKVEGRIPHPRSRVPTLSPRMNDIVMRALATSEADRFVNALDMAQALESAGAVAPRSQVAAWVERHAKEALAERAAVLSSVEAMARSVPPPAADETQRSSLAMFAPEALQAPGVPSVSVPNLAFTPPGRSEAPGRGSDGGQKRRTPWFVGGGAVGTVLVVGLAFALREPAATQATPSVELPAVAAAPTTAAAPPLTAPPPAVSPPAPSAPAEPTSVLAAAPEPPAPEPPTPEPAAKLPAAKPPAMKSPSAPRPTSPPKPREATKAALSGKSAAKAKNCNPPYTTDAQGRRKFKTECF